MPWSGLVGGLTVVSPALFSSGLPVPAFWSVPGVPGFSWPSGLVWPAFSPGVGVTVLSVPFSPGLVLSGAPWPCWSVPGLVSVPWPGWVLFSGAGVTVVPAPAWLFWSGVVPGWGVVVPVWVPPWPCCSVLPGVWSGVVPGLVPASCPGAPVPFWSGVVASGLVWVSGLASVPWSGAVGGLTVVSPALFWSGVPVCWPVPAFWSVSGAPGFSWFSWPFGLVWPAFSPGVGVTVVPAPFSPGLVFSGVPVPVAPWPCWSLPGLVSVPWAGVPVCWPVPAFWSLPGLASVPWAGVPVAPWPAWVLFSGAGVTVVPAPAWLFWSVCWPCVPGVGLASAFVFGVEASGFDAPACVVSWPCWLLPGVWLASVLPGLAVSWPAVVSGLAGVPPVAPAWSCWLLLPVVGAGVTAVPAPFSPGLVSAPWAAVPVCWPVVAFWSAPGVPWPCWPALWAGVTEASAWLFWGVPAFCSAWLPAGVVPASGLAWAGAPVSCALLGVPVCAPPAWLFWSFWAPWAGVAVPGLPAAGWPVVSTVPTVSLWKPVPVVPWGFSSACACPKNKNEPTIIEAVPTVNFLIE